MIGPPSSGKSMIAQRVPSIMPPPTTDEALEILSVQSIAANGAEADGLTFGHRPVRSPHHTISDVGLVGGGTIPGPGEVSLAHHARAHRDRPNASTATLFRSRHHLQRPYGSPRGARRLRHQSRTRRLT